MGVRPVTYHGYTGQQLEQKGFAVSDDLIKKDRELNRLLNDMEDELLNE